MHGLLLPCRACHGSKLLHHRRSRSKSERGAPRAACLDAVVQSAALVTSTKTGTNRYAHGRGRSSTVRSVKTTGKGRTGRTARPLGAWGMRITVADFSLRDYPIRGDDG